MVPIKCILIREELRFILPTINVTTDQLWREKCESSSIRARDLDLRMRPRPLPRPRHLRESPPDGNRSDDNEGPAECAMNRLWFIIMRCWAAAWFKRVFNQLMGGRVS